MASRFLITAEMRRLIQYLKGMAVLLKTAAIGWQNHRASRLGAALAYYMTFSIGPLLLLTLAIARRVFGEDAAQGRLISEIRDLTGEDGARAIQAMISGDHPATGIWATILGTLMLLFGATGVFGALQDALNTIWEVQTKPDRSLWDIVRERVVPFSVMLSTAFLLLVSLVVNAALATMSDRLAHAGLVMPSRILNATLSFFAIALLFTVILKYLPDTVVKWRHVWFGAMQTSLLFSIGKLAIGEYIGHSAFSSAYGAAGSLAALLVWLYYSAQIFLFGAELTRAQTLRSGARIVPARHAQRVTQAAKSQQGIGPGK
jgi:membrane protein